MSLKDSVDIIFKSILDGIGRDGNTTRRYVNSLGEPSRIKHFNGILMTSILGCPPLPNESQLEKTTTENQHNPICFNVLINSDVS